MATLCPESRYIVHTLRLDGRTHGLPGQNVNLVFNPIGLQRPTSHSNLLPQSGRCHLYVSHLISSLTLVTGSPLIPYYYSPISCLRVPYRLLTSSSIRPERSLTSTSSNHRTFCLAQDLVGFSSNYRALVCEKTGLSRMWW